MAPREGVGDTRRGVVSPWLKDIADLSCCNCAIRSASGTNYCDCKNVLQPSLFARTDGSDDRGRGRLAHIVGPVGVANIDDFYS